MHNIFLKMTDILNWLPRSPPFSLDKRIMPRDLKCIRGRTQATPKQQILFFFVADGQR